MNFSSASVTAVAGPWKLAAWFFWILMNTPSFASEVAKIVSSEYDDAQSSLTQAIELNPKYADALANQIPLATLGKPTGQTEALHEALAHLRSAAPQHALLRDLKEKERFFDEAFVQHREALSNA